jgi:predicted transcriptional regulator
MSRSKLEIYGDILKVLADKGPLKPKDIMCETNVKDSLLKGYLDFLVQQGLLGKQIVRKHQVVFVINQRGIKVLNYFKKLSLELPIFEEPQTIIKYLTELSIDAY